MAGGRRVRRYSVSSECVECVVLLTWGVGNWNVVALFRGHLHVEDMAGGGAQCV